MMKSHRKTLVLIGLFFTSLLVLLGLEWTGVYTGPERSSALRVAFCPT